VFFNTDKTKRPSSIAPKQLMDFIVEVCPAHIRRYGYRDKRGSYWAVSRYGMVWYDPDSCHETLEGAFHALIHGRGKLRPDDDRFEVEIKKRELQIAQLKLELAEAKPINHKKAE
jgi:hypothetical protein